MTASASIATGPSVAGGRRPGLAELALVGLFASLTLDTLDLMGGTAGAGNGITPAKLLTLLALFLWAGHCLLVKECRLLSVLGGNLTSYFVWGFLLVSILSNINVAGLVLVEEVSGPWGVVARRLTLAVLFFTIVAIVQRRSTMDLVILAYLIGGLATCFAGLYELYTGELFLGETLRGRTTLMQASDGGLRIQGLEVDPDVQATFLLFGVAMLPYLWHRASRLPARCAVLAIGVVYAVNLIAVGSKAGWIGLAMIVPLYLLLAEDRHKWRTATIGTLCGVAVLGALVWKADIVSLNKLVGKTDAHVNSIRAGLIQMSWAMVEDHPFIGAGSGAFIHEYQRYFRHVSSSTSSKPQPALNGYMQVWGDNGTLGLSALLLIFATVFAEAWSGWRKAVDPTLKMLGVSMLILFVLVVWAVGIYPVLDGKYVWLAFGMIIAYGNLVAAEAPREPSA